MKWFDQEKGYLSIAGNMYLVALEAKGIHRELAMEILTLLVPESELYNLEAAGEKE